MIESILSTKAGFILTIKKGVRYVESDRCDSTTTVTETYLDLSNYWYIRLNSLSND